MIDTKILNFLAMPICKLTAINKPTRMRNYDEDHFFGLLNTLYLCINARISLTTNIWIEHGLVNGATGVVRDIVFPLNRNTLTLPIAVFIEFDYYTGLIKVLIKIFIYLKLLFIKATDFLKEMMIDLIGYELIHSTPIMNIIMDIVFKCQLD